MHGILYLGCCPIVLVLCSSVLSTVSPAHTDLLLSPTCCLAVSLRGSGSQACGTSIPCSPESSMVKRNKECPSALTLQVRGHFLHFSDSLLLEVRFYYNLDVSVMMDRVPSWIGLWKVKNDANSRASSSRHKVVQSVIHRERSSMFKNK